MRLNTFLARAGLTSRRGAIDYLLEHDVRINGKPAREPGIAVDEKTDRVTVRGKQVLLESRLRYILLNKPTNVITTVKDPEGRATVLDCLPPTRERLYPVGRLDRDTGGVLLITNDGDLAFRLLHPRFKIVKIYEARVEGRFTDEAVEKLRNGVRIFDGSLGKAEVSIIARNERGSVLRLRLTEGKKHEVKQLCEVVGFPVRQLKRVQFADLDVHGMPQGAWRDLTKREIAHLKELTLSDTPIENRKQRDHRPKRTAVSKATPARREVASRPAKPRRRT